MDHPPAERMVDAARAWLAILTDEQRHQALAPWPSDDDVTGGTTPPPIMAGYPWQT